MPSFASPDRTRTSVGILYQVRINGQLRPEPNGETAESAWTPITGVAGFRRSWPGEGDGFEGLPEVVGKGIGGFRGLGDPLVDAAQARRARSARNWQ